MSLSEPPEEVGTGASVMTDPPLPIRTLATGEVVVEPLESVTTTPGKRDVEVTVDPRESVVVKVCSTLTDADAWKAEVVATIVLPRESVDVRITGTITPLATAELASGPEERVPAAMAAGVLVMVLPTELVVVTGLACGREAAEDATMDVTMVLPTELVVVSATVVGAMEETWTEDAACWEVAG